MSGQRQDGHDDLDPGEVVTGQDIEAYVGQELDVVLADLPGAGFGWVPREVPAGLALLSSDWTGGVPSEPGASRARTFRFAARRPGSYDLAFDLVRPWEPTEVAPARRHTVAVVVKSRGS